MSEQYVRKVQEHGTGKETRIPPEVCEKLGITDGGEIEFDLESGVGVVTLRKAGQGKTPSKPLGAEKPKKAITVTLGGQVCIISGKHGSGKTQLAEILCRNWRRLIVYDTLGEHTDGVMFEDLQRLKGFWNKVHHGNFRILYRPLHPKGDFDSICKLVIEYKPLTFVVENLDWYCRPPISPAFQKIIQKGCHDQIQLIGTTRRPDEIDKRLTSQTNQTYKLTSLAVPSALQAQLQAQGNRRPDHL